MYLRALWQRRRWARARARTLGLTGALDGVVGVKARDASGFPSSLSATPNFPFCPSLVTPRHNYKTLARSDDADDATGSGDGSGDRKRGSEAAIGSGDRKRRSEAGSEAAIESSNRTGDRKRRLEAAAETAIGSGDGDPCRITTGSAESTLVMQTPDGEGGRSKRAEIRILSGE